MEQFFAPFDRKNDGSIEFREYVTGQTILCNPANTEKILQMSFKLFDLDEDGFVTEPGLDAILWAALGVPDLDVSRFFQKYLDRIHITFHIRT